jgi:hypothetical protein
MQRTDFSIGLTLLLSSFQPQADDRSEADSDGED